MTSDIYDRPHLIQLSMAAVLIILPWQWFDSSVSPKDLFSMVMRPKDDSTLIAPVRVEKIHPTGILFKDTVADAILWDFIDKSNAFRFKDEVVYPRMRYIAYNGSNFDEWSGDKQRLRALEELFNKGLIRARFNPELNDYEFSPTDEGWKTIQLLEDAYQFLMFRSVVEGGEDDE